MPDANLFAAPQRLKRLQIEITTGCNLRCVGCQRTIDIAAGTWHNRHLKAERFAAILKNAPPADVLVLQGIGEPTLHPGLPDFIGAARATGKFGIVSFNTNALVRSLDDYAALQARGLGHVSVSVDSLDPATAEAARSGTDVAVLRRAIAGLAALFRNRITLSIVLSRLNLAELPQLLGELFALGGRVIEVQPLISYAAKIDPLCLDADDLERGRRIAAEATARWPGLSVLLAPALTPNFTRCRRPFNAAYVTVEGMLTPCCTTNDASLFGRTSLVEQDFATAWQSDGVRRWLDAYFDREPEICRDCAYNPSGRTAVPTAPSATAEPNEPAPPPLVDLAGAKALLQDGKLAEAEAAFAALGDGDRGEALHGLGLIRLQRGDAAGGLALLEEADAIASSARLSHNIALAFRQLGRRAEAIERERQNLAEHPEYIGAYHGLSDMLIEAGDRNGAAGVMIALCHRADKAGDGALAAQMAQRLVALGADHPGLLGLANALRSSGRLAAATALLGHIVSRDPEDLAARIVQTMAQLAIVHASEDEVAARRRAYTTHLAALAASTERASPTALERAAGQIGIAKPFYLAYQGHDDRALQQAYGGIVARLAAAARAIPAAQAAPRSGARLRIGFASSYFHLHSVSKLFGGWIRELDRSRFEVFVYHLDHGLDDATSRRLATAADQFRRGVGSQQDWPAAIAADRLDALIYPEIGMDPYAVKLACRRLAPVQCMAWGHPVTSGFPTIDYFLSSDLMEPEDGQAHYGERLVRLPNLSVWYEPLPAEGGLLGRRDLGLDPDAVVYVCCQSLFKYLPRYDAVFPRIAAQVPNAQFLFIALPSAEQTTIFRARLAAAFAAAGLDAARHCVFTPQVQPDRFPSLLRCGDVYLDSIGWSGGNTTLEAATCDLPIVTLPTALMRGRHSAAILRRMGLDAFIASSIEDYAAIAARLADPAERRAAAALVAERKTRLFRDAESVRGLEEFLLRAVAEAGARAPEAADAS